MTIPVIDHLLSEMESRFSAHHKIAFLELHLIPSILVTKAFNELEDVLKPLEALYASDLRDGSFSTELHQWFLKWKKEEETHGTQTLPKSLAYTLPQCSSYYTNIGILLRILYTLPVTSCSSKRSFTALKRVKTSIRSCMSNERLNSLTLLHVHTDIAIDIPQVIEEFSRCHPRRLRLKNILSND